MYVVFALRARELFVGILIAASIKKFAIGGKMGKYLTRILAVILSTAVLSFCTFGTAFAYNFYNESSVRFWNVNPTYQSYNAGAFDQMGYYFADCHSWMHIMNSSQNVPAGSIMSQAGMSVGNMWGTLTMEWGDAVTNTEQNSVLRNVSAYKYRGLNYTEGASAWGYGKIRSNDGSITEVTSSEIFLIVLTDPGIMSLGEGESSKGSLWRPDKDNFVGDDGLVYGVPYSNASGETVMPDMGRVIATNGEVGYIDIGSMETAVYNGATTAEGRAQAVADNINLEAHAFQQAFLEYFGIDSLSYDAAVECAKEIRYEDGKASARTAIQNDTREDLALAISEGSVADQRALSVLEDGVSFVSVEDVGQSALGNVAPNEIMITDDVLDEIYKLARPQLMVSVPVYASDRMTILGEYSFARL